ncbi:uncharacterized protein LOC117589698 [Drosophila guanche]|uniref:uncharacterized protein LOC117589698 n=1 Tax=Drosophila guanche TaxID=7266 RepID=UPI0014717680|nr:uncharacterized protein LOC117589698 [Drosophila guanche]
MSSLRLVLLCLALFVAVYAQPAPGAPEDPTETTPDVVTLVGASADGAQPRTLALLLPLLCPSEYSVG